MAALLPHRDGGRPRVQPTRRDAAGLGPMNSSPRSRLFTAVLPPGPAGDELAAAVAPPRPAGPGCRWTSTAPTSRTSPWPAAASRSISPRTRRPSTASRALSGRWTGSVWCAATRRRAGCRGSSPGTRWCGPGRWDGEAGGLRSSGGPEDQKPHHGGRARADVPRRRGGGRPRGLNPRGRPHGTVPTRRSSPATGRGPGRSRPGRPAPRPTAPARPPAGRSRAAPASAGRRSGR